MGRGAIISHGTRFLSDLQQPRSQREYSVVRPFLWSTVDGPFPPFGGGGTVTLAKSLRTLRI